MKTTKPIIYLAGPIQHATPDQRDGWRDRIIRNHSDDFELLDPREYVPDILEIDYSFDANIIKADLALISRCNVLLAYTPFPSVGTSMEIFYAHRFAEKMVVVWHPSEAGLVSPWITAHASVVVRNLEDAMRYIKSRTTT